MADALCIVTTTYPDREQAETAADHLVGAGLAACAQVGTGVTSFYRWQGETRRDDEVPVAFKVLAERVDLFVGELRMHHPYDVPQILTTRIDRVEPDYLAWARGKEAPDA